MPPKHHCDEVRGVAANDVPQRHNRDANWIGEASQTRIGIRTCAHGTRSSRISVNATITGLSRGVPVAVVPVEHTRPASSSD